MTDRARVGAVVIGRNEGQRLISCLQSLRKSLEHVVYVDSGSSDNSLQAAQALGVETVSLDMAIPFTAARARNKGARYLLESHPELQFIQFIDGDCELQDNWIKVAGNFLESHDDYAVVCGRRRERFPENSIYNQLCDIEWDTPVGDVLACGGDALVRVAAFKQVNGYRDDLIAGEEPEMCFRLRKSGWKIRRIDAEMTLHDAAMTKMGQWWKRAMRAGYAYAASFDLHGRSEEKFKLKEVRSIIFWALFLPLAILLLSLYHVSFLSLFLIYPLQVLKIAIKMREKRHDYKQSLIYAISVVMAKWPQLLGIVKFYWNKLKGTSGRLIEYK